MHKLFIWVVFITILSEMTLKQSAAKGLDGRYENLVELVENLELKKPDISITCDVPKSMSAAFQSIVDQFSAENGLIGDDVPSKYFKLSYNQSYRSSSGLELLIIPEDKSVTDKSFNQSSSVTELMKDIARYRNAPPYYEKQNIYLYSLDLHLMVEQIARSLEEKLRDFKCTRL